ncbi:MAG: cyclic nucleotide-binding domain-containing protein [Deltaproteobacteria bacterium]
MIARAVARWLDLPEGQGGRALRMLTLVLCLSAALAMMKSAQSGIFLAVCERAAIPWAFAASSVALALLSAGFVSLARRLSTPRLAALALALAALALLALRVLVARTSVPRAFATNVVIEALSGVLVIQVWAVVTGATDARTARRLLPGAGIGSGVAWALAGFFVAPLTAAFGAPALLVAAPIALALAAGCVRLMTARDLEAREHAPVRGAAARGGSLLRTLRFVARVPLLRVMTALSLLALIVEEVMDFHVMSAAREEMQDAAAIASFFGRYYAITSLVGVLLLAGPASRVLGGLGATRSLAVTPLATCLAAIVATVVPGLGPAVALRAIARVLKQTLWSNSQEQMQSPIAHARRAETRAAIRGVLAPLGYAVAAILLALVPPHLDERWLAALVAALSLVMLVLVVSSARSAYVAALRRAVDERRLVLGTGRLPRVPVVDVEAASVLSSEIESVDPDRAELAAEVLGAAPAAIACAPLVNGLSHPSPEVRRAAAESLGRVPSVGSIDARVQALSRERVADNRVLVARALREVLDASPDRFGSAAVAPVLDHADAEPDPRVRATLRALAARRWRSGEELGEALLPLLRSERSEERRAALGELTLEALLARGVVDAMRASLERGGPDERVEAAETAVALGVVGLLPDVVTLLRDATVGTRVARLLVAIGDDAFGESEPTPAGQSTVASLTVMARRIANRGARGDALVRRLLAHRDRAIRRAAVQALAQAVRAGEREALPEGVTTPLVEAELRCAYGLLEIDTLLAADGSGRGSLAALRREIALRLDASRADLLLLLSLSFTPRAGRGAGGGTVIEAIEASRRSSSAQRDAQVAELLENAIGGVHRAAVVALFERGSSQERLEVGRREGLSRRQDADALARIVASGDVHLRRMAAIAFQDAPGHENEYARRYPSLHAEDLPMIPRFERIRFLRRVPLFESLPGEDLVSVAAVLEELELEDGEIVFRRGDRGEDLFVVVQGAVEIGEPDHVLARLGETEFFGDLAVLDLEGRSADATARGTTKLLLLRGADLRELMATRPEITQAVVRVLVARLRDASDKLAS